MIKRGGIRIGTYQCRCKQLEAAFWCGEMVWDLFAECEGGGCVRDIDCEWL